MASKLRSDMIRLAYVKPELRPLLLPMLKSGGWIIPYPRDAWNIQYEGEGSDEAATALGVLMRRMVGSSQKHAKLVWRALASALMKNAAYEGNPAGARAAASNVMRYCHMNLAEDATKYFDNLPVPPK